MFARITTALKRPVEVGSRSFPAWQIGLATVSVLIATRAIYKRVTRPKYSSSTTAEEMMEGVDLTGRRIIVTGASAGLGKETAKQLVKAGATVIMACRNPNKTEKAMSEIAESFNENERDEISKRLVYMDLDLSSLGSVYEFAKQYSQTYDSLDQLINNAGVMAIKSYETTGQSFEKQFGINHMGHAYLTLLLTPLLSKSKYNGRVICLASSAHHMSPPINIVLRQIIKSKYGPEEKDYSPWGNYGIAKACNILFAREYNKRNYTENNVAGFSLHPGGIWTDLQRHINLATKVVFTLLGGFFFKSVSQGISTTLRCVLLTENEIQEYNGNYFVDCNPMTISKSSFRDPIGNSLRSDLNPKHNNNIEKLQADFYDWTIEAIKKCQMPLEIN